MGRPVKEGLRLFSKPEEQELQRVVKAPSERAASVRRAKALLAVAVGKSRTVAGQEAGLSREAVTQVMKGFNQRGLDILSIAPGRGCKPTYTSEQYTRIVAEGQCDSDRKADQTATWSLMTLRSALRKTDLLTIAAETVRQVLHEAGYSYQRTSSWVHTGYALRKRKSGTITTYDQEAPEKKIDRASLRAGGSRRHYAVERR
ncbi:MAG TPA: helix-turn-helix domain-containing protein [Ktedonobacteraceae bacterium]|nr:helix-turn-helix domain-containing protein [Ktedonobacteraceae bacterium]